MISFLQGQPVHHTAQSVIINVQGVGYEVRVNERLLQQLLSQKNTDIQLTTHLINKEDSLELYGFQSPQEKDIFLQLTKVSGIGPRTALAIFSILDFTEIVRAIVSNQPQILSQAPGVGKKTAQRIILELKEKLSKMHALQLGTVAETPSDLPQDWQEEIELTLLALGYSPSEIQQSLQKAGQMHKNSDSVDDLLRTILAELSE